MSQEKAPTSPGISSANWPPQTPGEENPAGKAQGQDASIAVDVWVEGKKFPKGEPRLPVVQWQGDSRRRTRASTRGILAPDKKLV